MRINPVNNFTYTNKINNRKSYSAQPMSAPDSFAKSPSFNGWFSSRKVAKFLSGDLSYSNPETRLKFIELCNATDFSKETKLVEKAKSLLQNSTKVSNNALFAAHLVLFGLNDGTLSKLENQDNISPILQAIFKAQDDSLVLDIITPEDLDVCLKANPEIDVNKYYRKGSSLILRAAKLNDSRMVKYLVNRDDADLYNKELWSRLLKDGDQTYNLIKELPKENFNVNQMEFAEGETLFAELLRNRYSKSAIYLLKYYPDLDTNVYVEGKHPLVKFYPGGNYDVNLELFKELYQHPRTDRSIFLNSGITPFSALQHFMEQVADKDFEKSFRTMYEKNGTFSLKEMDMIVNYNNFKKFAHKRINLIGDRFVHLLSDIRIDEKNPDEMAMLIKIVTRLEEAGCSFNTTNDLGQTPLNRAMEADNKPVVNLLRMRI